MWGEKVSLGGGSRSWCHLLGILEEEEEKYHAGFQRWWHTMAGARGHPLRHQCNVVNITLKSCAEGTAWESSVAIAKANMHRKTKL